MPFGDRRAQFEIVETTSDRVLIKDIGPWDQFPTVTNDAEAVVAHLAPKLAGRKLYYIDSEGDLDEIKVRDGKFDGFGPGPARRAR